MRCATNLKTQDNLNTIADWTVQNKMKLNEDKTNYMVFCRSENEMATRLEEVKLVGVWLTTWLDWDKNTKELFNKAYARMTMLTKCVGINHEDLVEQSLKIENVQKLCLKVIFGSEYSSNEVVWPGKTE